MDRSSAIPHDLRMHTCSYYLNSHTDHLCTLEIAQGETGHGEAIKDRSQTILRIALKLEETTRTSTANISALIQQIKSTVSALSATNKVEEWTKMAKLARTPAIVRHSIAIAALRRVADELDLSTEIQPTKSCRPFFSLAHVNQRTRADLLSISSKYEISGDMKVFQKLLPRIILEWRELMVFVHLFVGNGGGPYSSEVQQQFASLSHLSSLKTAYISGVLDDPSAQWEEDDERLGLSYRGRSTAYLLKTLEYRGIRTALYLEQHWESFERDSVRSEKWRN